MAVTFLKEIKPDPKGYVVSIGNLVEWKPEIEPIPGEVIVEKRIIDKQFIRKAGIFPLYDRAVKQTLLKRLMPRFRALYREHGMQGILIEDVVAGRELNRVENIERLLEQFYNAFSQIVMVNGMDIEFHLPPSIQPKHFKVLKSGIVLTKTPLTYLYTGEKDRERRIQEDKALIDKIIRQVKNKM